MKTKNQFIITSFIIITFTINSFAMPSYNDVLVVVNDKSSESVEIGNYFANARNIPAKNICHISTTDKQGQGSEDGRLTLIEKQSVANAVKQYMTDNNLTDSINYIVLTRGIPYFSQNDIGASTYQLFDLYLLFQLSDSTIDKTIPDIFSFNKYYYYILDNYNNFADHQFARNKYGYYIVSRLDGPGVVNVKQLINNTGYPAYQSYKKGIKYLTITPFFPSAVKAEIENRGNIKVVAPDLAHGEDMRDIGQNIMFAFLNRVDFSFPLASDVTPLAPYSGSAYYADGDVVTLYPNIYTGLSFLPGSQITCFRSGPAQYNHRVNGGACKVDLKTGQGTDFKKYDGSDIKFRHMTCVAYDPENNWIWCGTGHNPLEIYKNYNDTKVSGETHHKYESRRGGGIAILKADTGEIVNHFTAENSNLLNNRVTCIAYDKYNKYIWIAHYGGIQYYDIVNKAWHEISELKNDFAAAAYIYVDSYDTDKVYFSFYYDGGKISSLIPKADTGIFEYSKSNKSVTSYTIDATVGVCPFMVKTSASDLWVTKGKSLIKYDLASRKIITSIQIKDLIPDFKDIPAKTSIAIGYPRCIAAHKISDNEKYVFVGIS
ncbi:MAG: hypothetical protein ACYC2P_12705, partial [Paludibacteraceae bacterium]